MRARRWPDALAEDHLPGSSVGPLVAAGLHVQFERLRDRDGFWYERDSDFTAAELDLLTTPASPTSS